MKQIRTRIAFALLVCLSILPAVKAQEKTAPTGVVLKITFLKSVPPAFQSVPAKDSDLSGAWYARFGQVNGWELPAGQLPVRAVKIISRLETDASARIVVSVLTGQKLHEKEESVATFALRENENIVVDQLKQFGVEPFTIALTRIAPTVADLPAIVNETNSLTIISVEPNFSTLPTFKLRIRNSSNKSVKALSFEVAAAGRTMFTGMPQGIEAKALIAPDEIAEINVPSARKSVKTAEGDKVEPLPNQTIFIHSAVFDDQSFEGNSRKASEFLAFSTGRKLQLKRVLALLDKTSEIEKPLKWLETEIANLPVNPEDAAFKELTDKFPDFNEKERNNLRIGVEVAMQGVKKSALDELAQFKKTDQSIESKTEKDWISALKQRYQEWLLSLR
jgi:hypothetical protein